MSSADELFARRVRVPPERHRQHPQDGRRYEHPHYPRQDAVSLTSCLQPTPMAALSPLLSTQYAWLPVNMAPDQDVLTLIAERSRDPYWSHEGQHRCMSAKATLNEYMLTSLRHRSPSRPATSSSCPSMPSTQRLATTRFCSWTT